MTKQLISDSVCSLIGAEKTLLLPWIDGTDLNTHTTTTTHEGGLKCSLSAVINTLAVPRTPWGLKNTLMLEPYWSDCDLLGLGCGLHVRIGNNCGKTHKTYHWNHFKEYSPVALMTFTMSYNCHHYQVVNFLITLKGSLMPVRQPLQPLATSNLLSVVLDLPSEHFK